VLLDRTIQWMFHKSKLIEARENGNGSYVELVVSSSKSLIEKSRGEIVDLAVRELGEFFPVVREAKLVKSTVIKEVHATYSPRPEWMIIGPTGNSLAACVFGGDFVATGWPATWKAQSAAGISGRVAGEGLRCAGSEVPRSRPSGKRLHAFGWLIGRQI